METVSLQKIIDMVLEEAPSTSVVDNYDNEKRTLYRKFERLIEKLGANKETVKKGGRKYEFRETEVPWMKVILSQLHTDHGVIAEFVNRKKRKNRFSSKEVRELIQSILDEMDKNGAAKVELEEMAIFFNRIFRMSSLRAIENCHNYIDALAMNLQDLEYDQEAQCLNEIERLLGVVFMGRCLKLAINCADICNIIVSEYDDTACPYEGLPPEIVYTYMERDRELLECIQEDDALREYIEKKFSMKAEQIFRHVV